MHACTHTHTPTVWNAVDVRCTPAVCPRAPAQALQAGKHSRQQPTGPSKLHNTPPQAQGLSSAQPAARTSTCTHAHPHLPPALLRAAPPWLLRALAGPVAPAVGHQPAVPAGYFAGRCVHAPACTCACGCSQVCNNMPGVRAELNIPASAPAAT